MEKEQELYASETTPLVGSGSNPAKKWSRFLPGSDNRPTTIDISERELAGGALVDPNPVVGQLSTAELDDLVEIFASKDKEEDKTWARRIVEKWLSENSIYFPGKDKKNGPSLTKAWAFYEHITLPRYLWRSADHKFRLADPGETEKTVLYTPATMPQSCFIEFGLGVDQYFCTLQLLSFVFLICFFINIPTMMYYSSTKYSGEGGKSHLPWALRASAICTRKSWAVCKDCVPDQWQWAEQTSIFGTAPDGTVLVQRNNCGGSLIKDGAIDFGTFWFLTFFFIFLCFYLKSREARFDEDRLTADDYSLKVQNPPPDAKNPDEWRDFFNRFADKQVTMVTVAINNEVMLEKLVERRLHIMKLRSLLPDYVDLGDDAMVRAALSRIVKEHESAKVDWAGKPFEAMLRATGMLFSAKQSQQRLHELTDDIKKLQKKKYDVSSVFVTFETEEGQRRALSSLSPEPPRLFKSGKATSKQIPAFRGNTLIVNRAAEPSSINWLHLSSRPSSTAIVMVVNLAITLVTIVFAAYCENLARKYFGPVWASPLVSVFNSSMPYLVEVLMYFEHHRTEDTWQASYFAKITLFRWVNTAIIVKVFTPFTSNLDDDQNDVLPSMYYILISELLVTPFLMYADLSGNFKRHFSAPRARTQQEMNWNFIGTPYRLGERYTAMTNILFVCFFYSAMFPAVFLMGFSILLIQYFVDKYCLVRIWKRAPAIGANLSRISRRYFFSAALVVFICSSAFAWAQFPYDNVCDKVGSTERVSQTEFDNVRLLDGSLINITVSQVHPVYHCSQDLQEMDTLFAFPPTPRIQPKGLKWMTKSQEEVCKVFGWTSLAFVIGFVAYFVRASLIDRDDHHLITNRPFLVQNKSHFGVIW